jgi:L-fuconolactonase
MIIDAHQHFWQYDPVRHAWIDDTMQRIRRDFLPPELESIYRSIGVDGCVAVEADQSENETRYLLGLADEYSFIKAVVGWVDLRADLRTLEERLEFFSGFTRLAGFRYLLQAEEPERMLESSFIRGIGALKKFGYTFDLLIYPRHLDAALKLVRRFPDQPFVVDHLAKTDIKKNVMEPWTSRIRMLGEMDNVWCKVSGMVTEADWNRWETEDLLPWLDHVFVVFGTQRLMFGSDWPVCLLAGTYERVYSAVANYVDSLSGEERRNVMGLNAARFYSIHQ